MPTLIDVSQFDKDLSSFAHKGDTETGNTCYFISSLLLYKLTEIKIIDPEDDIHTCVTIHQVSHQSGSDDEMLSRIDDLYDQGNSESNIIRVVLRETDEARNRLVGRIALRNFTLRNYAQQYEMAPQVCAVKVERAYQQKGIVSYAYLALLNWYSYLISDDFQTVLGAKIWANSLSVRADVQVYDYGEESFCGILGPCAMTNEGFLPWGSNPMTNLFGWEPNLLRTQPKNFIVLVLSKESSPEIGYTPLKLKICSG